MVLEDAVYVCMRTTDMPVPYVPCYKGKCKDCKQDVYYSKYAYENDAIIKGIVDAGNLICSHCMVKLPNPEVKIREATLKEVASTYVDDKLP